MPGPPIVIHAGLFRTGTASMAAAYEILGLRTWHGMNLLEDLEVWPRMVKVVEATTPTVPGGRPAAPPTRAEWDAIFGDYDVAADWAGWFAEDLANAYPDAKVVIVQRGFDAWWESIDKMFDPLWRWPDRWFGAIADQISGWKIRSAAMKLFLGRFGATGPTDIDKEKARKFYYKYYDHIRQVIPEERKLEYKLGSGWEPLCEFLGKEVPVGKDFPRINELAATQAQIEQAIKNIMGRTWKRILPWFLTLGAASGVAIGVWISRMKN